ncbi:MAG TPA: arylamine N-acetyltransferase [Candidatus Kapabacteria bacterium]|nr:arylamine N-acetyltransferase [Candidatus Kapabacteria bacterium]
MISQPLLDRVLAFLDLPHAVPDAAWLARMLDAYTRRVPWESASRIVRRAEKEREEECPRWPEEFWETVLRERSGGTCFETNYAVHAVLRRLGATVDLTINDMGNTVGCHTALIVHRDGMRLLVDPGFPVHVVLPLEPGRDSVAANRVMEYSAHFEADECYRIERDIPLNRYCYTLHAVPVSEAEYRRATVADYRAEGLFLDRVVINTVIGDCVWRFTSAERPWHLQAFVERMRVDHMLEGSFDENLERITRTFGMSPDTVRAALELIGAR